MAIFKVLNTDDSGAGSLRQAILDANAKKGRDLILFDKGLKNQTITLTSGELLITDDLRIRGLGSDKLTISGGGNSRVFNIDDGTDELIEVRFTGLKITDGLASSSNGGGIQNTEELVIRDSTITDNTADSASGFGGVGGGIYNNDGILRVVKSDITQNTAFDGGGISNTSKGSVIVVKSSVSNNNPIDNGGGIYNGGTLKIINSNVSDNTTISDDGGGIFNFGTLEVINSDITGNKTNTSGGGIANDNILIVRNSNINDNTAGGGAGGIFNGGNSFSDVINSDITGNSTDTSGGGIFNFGTFELKNSDITGNTANDDGGGIFNDGRFGRGIFEATKSTISLNKADFDMNGSGNGGGVFNTVTGNFINNSTDIFNNTPENIFTPLTSNQLTAI
ncbi:MAG: hypothetical protein KI793_23095 [Rivularia sp. (in: Bacteria)]|nr:hypothetical protein [Rivularia sp. MS3]